jgi:hypothetical protein
LHSPSHLASPQRQASKDVATAIGVDEVGIPVRFHEPRRWLHAKAAMWSAMIVANVFLQHAVGVDIIAHDDVIEAIAA